MKRSILAFALLIAVGMVASPAIGAVENDADAADSIFDGLEAAPDVIYLIANSSLIVGPDPNGRSEEITFVGPVTSPKWPQEGFNRRTLEDGRQQIDIELTESQLVGESYLMGRVTLGEHPDLRSLGTITQRMPGDDRPYVASNLRSDLAAAKAPGRTTMTASAANAAGTAKMAASGELVPYQFQVTPAVARTIELNPEVNWDARFAQGFQALMENASAVQEKRVQPAVLPPVTAGRAPVTVELPKDVVSKMESSEGVDWDGWMYQVAQTEFDQLAQANQIVRPPERYEAAVVPNDFLVARKVLITTAKGLLYNEAPVPVRGTINSIPPVRRENTPVGMNVFLGMELPVPLLNEEGNVDGWFYSKAHMAYAVEPQAVQRETAEASLTIRFQGKEETIALEGPIEIHHNGAEETAHGKNTKVEVIVLALRGQSELLGGEVMMVESFSDRDRFSRGTYVWRDGEAEASSLDLFAQIYTPFGKLSNTEPIPMTGKVPGLVTRTRLQKQNLDIPFVAMSGESVFEAQAGRALYDEAERRLAEVVDLSLKLTGKEDQRTGPEPPSAEKLASLSQGDD
ncbi:MAG: hypothetical protein PVG07_05515 [Acidobacteriota bacterium]